MVKRYATKSSDEFVGWFAEHPKASVIALLTDLITTYMNDPNSSYLRELAVVSISQRIRRLNGRESFNDHTWARFEKDLKENLNVLTAGFIESKLISINEFPFGCLKNRIREVLEKHLPTGNFPSRYVRSVSFFFKHYRDCPKLRTLYSLPCPELSRFERYNYPCQKT